MRPSAGIESPGRIRTTSFDCRELTGIVDDKRASIALNKLDDEDIADAIDELWDSAQAAKPDAANVATTE